jgi:chromosome segregation ATPase
MIYKKLTEKVKQTDDEIAAALEAIQQANAPITKLSNSALEYKDDLRELRMRQKDPEALKKYLALKEEITTKKNEIMRWVYSKPERNKENTKKYEAMKAEFDALKAKLDALEAE